MQSCGCWSWSLIDLKMLLFLGRSLGSVRISTIGGLRLIWRQRHKTLSGGRRLYKPRLGLRGWLCTEPIGPTRLESFVNERGRIEWRCVGDRVTVNPPVGKNRSRHRHSCELWGYRSNSDAHQKPLMVSRRDGLLRPEARLRPCVRGRRGISGEIGVTSRAARSVGDIILS